MLSTFISHLVYLSSRHMRLCLCRHSCRSAWFQQEWVQHFRHLQELLQMQHVNLGLHSSDPLTVSQQLSVWLPGLPGRPWAGRCFADSSLCHTPQGKLARWADSPHRWPQPHRHRRTRYSRRPLRSSSSKLLSSSAVAVVYLYHTKKDTSLILLKGFSWLARLTETVYHWRYDKEPKVPYCSIKGKVRLWDFTLTHGLNSNRTVSLSFEWLY